MRIRLCSDYTAFSTDKADKYAALLKNKRLRYVDKTRALMWASSEGSTIFQLLTTELADPGSSYIVKENTPFVNTNFSASMEKVTLNALNMLQMWGKKPWSYEFQ